jgi:hypothetical protein
VTKIVNQNNRRSNRLVTFNGETMSVANWARKIGISQRTIHARLDRGSAAEVALHPGYVPHCRLRTKP